MRRLIKRTTIDFPRRGLLRKITIVSIIALILFLHYLSSFSSFTNIVVQLTQRPMCVKFSWRFLILSPSPVPVCNDAENGRDFDHVPVTIKRDFTVTSHTAHGAEDPIPGSYYVQSVSCPLLWQGDPTEQARAVSEGLRQPRCESSMKEYVRRTGDCQEYRRKGGFTVATVSEEEKAFPLAYSILVYKDTDQVERLVRAIYRPHNVYCVHVDKGSAPSFRFKVAQFAKCLPNVFLSNVSVHVRWGELSTLQTEIVCMRQLLEHAVKWRYFINLTGQEFPLKTNRELVQVLTAFQGANYISNLNSESFSHRWRHAFPAPYDLRPVKGDLHITAVRGFVDYLVNSNVARRFLQWANHTYIPDEFFFNTLNYDTRLGAPGSCNEKPSHVQTVFPLRYKQWCNDVCHGIYLRAICQFGVGDLPFLTSTAAMFANKFLYPFEPLGYDCLEQWLLFKVHRELSGNPLPLNVSFYSNTWPVRHRYNGPVKMW